MKKTQFKHTVKLKTKQPDLYGYLIKVFLGILPIICVYLTQCSLSILNKVGIVIILPTSLYFISYALFLLNTFLTIYFSPISFSKNQRIKNTLLKVIEINDFYYENKELNKITLSMKMKFYWFQNNLYIEVYPSGGKFTKKMNELTSIFETSLNMTVLSVQDDFANHTTYILSNQIHNFIDSSNDWEV